MIAPCVDAEARRTFERRGFIAQSEGHQPASRWRRRIAWDAFAIVGNQGPAPTAGDAEPGAAADGVSSGEDALRPPLRRLGNARVKLVAVGCNQQLITWMRLERDQSKAHGSMRSMEAARLNRGDEALDSTLRPGSEERLKIEIAEQS